MAFRIDGIQVVFRTVLLVSLGVCWRVSAHSAESKYALLIGVTTYEHARMNDTKLKYPETDAKAVGALLASSGYKVDLLLGKQATLESVKTAIKKVQKQGDADGIVLVGLFGHGVEYTDRENPKELGAFFGVYDTGIRAVTDSEGHEILELNGLPKLEPDPTTMLSLRDVLSALSVSPAGRHVVLADCCREDSSAARGRSSAFGTSLSLDQLPPKTSALFACSKNEQAFEHDDWGHGAFTKAFLDSVEKLQGDGEVNNQLLAYHIGRMVNTIVPEKTNGRRQTVNPLNVGNFNLLLLGSALTDQEFDQLYLQADHAVRTDNSTVLQDFLREVAPKVRGTSFPLALQAMRAERRGWATSSITHDLKKIREQANVIDPDSEHTLLINGLYFRSIGDSETALKYYRKCVEKNPFLVEGHLGIVWIETEDSDGDADKGTTYAKDLIKQFPADYRVYNAYGTRLFNQHKWEEGLKQLDQAIKLAPRHPLLWNNYAYGLHGAERISESLVAYKNTAELAWDNSSELLANCAYVMCETDTKGAFKDALRYVNQGLLLNDQRADLWEALRFITDQLHQKDSRIGSTSLQSVKAQIDILSNAVTCIEDRGDRMSALNLRSQIFEAVVEKDDVELYRALALQSSDIKKIAELDLLQLEIADMLTSQEYKMLKARLLYLAQKYDESLSAIDQILRELSELDAEEDVVEAARAFRKRILKKR